MNFVYRCENHENKCLTGASGHNTASTARLNHGSSSKGKERASKQVSSLETPRPTLGPHIYRPPDPVPNCMMYRSYFENNWAGSSVCHVICVVVMLQRPVAIV